MRRMSLTPELVALCHRDEIDPGPSGEWTQLSDDDFGALAARLAGEADEGPLWVFAYGSLIWKPAFESVEQQRASAHGWHRSFCLDMVRWRGSAAQPGLMMALERGGRCDGVIYRLPDGEKPAQIERLLRREIDDHESVASVRWVPVRTARGRVRALGFWVGVKGRGTSLGQPLELFYLVRAVTPGKYVVPATFAEDMYRPEVRGIGKAEGEITVVDKKGP